MNFVPVTPQPGVEFPYDIHKDVEVGRMLRNDNLLIIHSMAEYVMGFDGILRSAFDHLLYEKLSVHYLMPPQGPLQSTLPMVVTGAHCAPYNFKTVGVELLIPGITTLVDLKETVSRRGAAYDVYTRNQYHAVLSLTNFLYEAKYLTNPFDIRTHQMVNPQKPDTGAAFHFDTVIQLLRTQYPEELYEKRRLTIEPLVELSLQDSV
jgi:N-acetyl-anhydromuramyl-L-alanine amidase AmpD